MERTQLPDSRENKMAAEGPLFRTSKNFSSGFCNAIGRSFTCMALERADRNCGTDPTSTFSCTEEDSSQLMPG
jgi:hypothetical protein